MGIFGLTTKKEAEKIAEKIVIEKLKSINVVVPKNYSNDSMVFKNSAANYIQDKILENGFFAGEGRFYIDKPIRLSENNHSILSRLTGNNGFHLYTDKPIDLIEVCNYWPQRYVRQAEISGVTLHHLGKEVGKEYAAVKVGGGGKQAQTVSTTNKYNFNYYGNDEGHGVLVDFQNSRWGTSWHFCDIKGVWNNVNVGVKAIEKEGFLHPDGKTKYDYMNTLDLDVTIYDAKTYFDLRGLDFSRIQLRGQEAKDQGDNLLYNIKGGGNLEFSCFIYDIRRNNRLGNISLDTSVKKGVEYKGKLTPFGYCIRKGRVQIQCDRELFDKTGELVTSLEPNFIT